ncbi:J domain-containing protein [Stenomitos frigidus]|uniref:Molecular chaperone DnaJ n=1 Tax=Stenomitos frigidus ULC18 TaxID=2107698 RepID=A0A2T1DWH3_9CYAN|nr:J domain-containing protein [Stenomitos frigidus]PSB24848.1 molecular chaperone DnaJ [Stenomitos frigidus ULC18]
MNLAECYRILGLESGASFDAIKASYRRLARRYHPDVNPGNQHAKDKFIELTEAYRFLLSTILSPEPEPPKATGRQPPSTTTGGTRITRKQPPLQYTNLSPLEQQLKTNSYQQLQQMLKEQRFPRAIALIEGLARRIPQDPEVKQWQAIAYQRWGRQLIQERQLDKARIYLKKALRTDPHNRSLWAEVERDFRYMERLF